MHIAPDWYENISKEKKDVVDSCYIPTKKLNYSDEDIEELKNNELSLFPDFFQNIHSNNLKEILGNMAFFDYDLTKYDDFDFFDWNILEIKTNLAYKSQRENKDE